MTKKDISRASSTGFHFYNLYQNCPRKFFLRYIARLVPKTTSPELIFGAAFHEGKATFYKTHSKEKAIKKALKEMKDRRTEYQDDDVWQVDYEKMQVLLEAWINQYGYEDLKIYKILGVEMDLSGTLPNGMKISGRLDLVVQDKSSSVVYIFDTKTSGSSWKLTELNVYNSDQATGYIWLMKKNFPELNVVGLIADIAYWNRKTENPDNILLRRGDLVYRTVHDLAIYEQEVGSILMDISQRVQAFRENLYPANALFPKNTFYCNAYFRECEYRDICRYDVTLKGRAPVGFKRDRYNKKLYTLDTAVEVLA